MNVSVDGSSSHSSSRTHAIGSLWAFLFVLLGATSLVAAQGTATFKGTLSDEQLTCIQTPLNGPEGIKDKTACMLYLAHSVKPGSKYILYDPATKTKYQLDDQDLVQPYVGAKEVEITGTLDAATKTIKVKAIKALS